MELNKEELFKTFDGMLTDKFIEFEEKIKNNYPKAYPISKSDLTINDKKDLEMEFRKFVLGCLTNKVDKDISGTYIVPTIMANELIKLTFEKSIFLQKAKVYVEPSGKLSVPFANPAYMNPTNGYFGGMIVYPIDTEIPESQPSFKNASLIARGYGAYTEISRKLLTSTTFNMNSTLVDMFTDALGWYIDYKCLNGAGTTEPLGILNAGAKLTVNRASSNQVGVADLAGMYALLLATPSENNVCWLSHPTTYKYLLQLTAGNNWVFVNPVTKKLDMSLFGYPAFKTPSCSALGTAGDVILADLNAYGLLLQEGISIFASEHFKFRSELICLKGVCYFDGQPLVDTYSDIGNTSYMSPFVVLN